MTGLDWSAIGTALTGLFIGVGGFLMGRKKAAAESDAAVADFRSSAALSQSEAAVYKMLGDRLTALEGEVKGLRSELDTERLRSRQLELLSQKLELHIFKLETLMREKGITPPIFSEVAR